MPALQQQQCLCQAARQRPAASQTVHQQSFTLLLLRSSCVPHSCQVVNSSLHILYHVLQLQSSFGAISPRRRTQELACQQQQGCHHVPGRVPRLQVAQ